MPVPSSEEKKDTRPLDGREPRMGLNVRGAMLRAESLLGNRVQELGGEVLTRFADVRVVGKVQAILLLDVGKRLVAIAALEGRKSVLQR